MRRTVRGNRAPRRRVKDAPTPTQQVAQRLREHVPPRRFWIEHYGPDGEIEEAWEGAVLAPGDKLDGYQVTQHGYAEPKTDWRKRGVIPRLGIHWAERDEEANPPNGRRAGE